jgi:hypothetical protein
MCPTWPWARRRSHPSCADLGRGGKGLPPLTLALQMAGGTGVSHSHQAKILLMRPPHLLSRKNEYPLAALYSALWWSSCALLFVVITAAIASADLKNAQAAATVQSISNRSTSVNNDRHSSSGAPADKFPQPAIFHKCGALGGFFLRPGRKPGPYDASSPTAPATCLYLDEAGERRLPSPIAMGGAVGHRDIYLHCCSFLI